MVVAGRGHGKVWVGVVGGVGKGVGCGRGRQGEGGGGVVVGAGWGKWGGGGREEQGEVGVGMWGVLCVGVGAKARGEKNRVVVGEGV